MAKITLDTVTGGYDLSVINSNFDKIETDLNTKVLYRDNPVGEANTLQQDLDVNNKTIYNVASVSTTALTINGQPVVANETFVTALPDPVGQNTKILKSNGTTASWVTNDSVSITHNTTSETVKDALDKRVPEIDTYAALRAYSGPLTSFYVKGISSSLDGGHGIFRVDASDVTSSDNGGTILVDASSRRWKREFIGPVYAVWFGVKGDSNGTTGNGTNSTALLQAAINFTKASGGSYKLVLPEGVIRTTSVITVDGALTLSGEGVSPYNAAIGTRGNGSWIYFDHAGKGVSIDGAAVLSGVSLSGFGTLRNQPAPVVSWTPNANDYDIFIDNADVMIKDLMLLNPTKGIYLTNGSYGRLEIDTLRGQAFQEFIRIGTSYDVVKINNLHHWPFWQDNMDVHTYTMTNLDVVYFERVDNPMLSNIFTIFARAGIRFGQNVDGKTSKIHLANADFDRGQLGIWVDSTVTGGVTGQFENITHQGETGFSGSKAVFVQGNNSTMEFGQLRTDLCNQNAIRCEGTGNKLLFHAAPFIVNYDQSALNFPAIEIGAGNTARITGKPDISGGGGVGGKYGGAGTVYVDEWRATTPTITAETGTITTLGAVTGAYKLWNDTLNFTYDIAITTNGTGAGAVRATLPFTPASNNMIASGREIAVSGKMLSGNIGSGLARVDIRNYDNSYPAADGARVVINGSVRVA